MYYYVAPYYPYTQVGPMHVYEIVIFIMIIDYSKCQHTTFVHNSE